MTFATTIRQVIQGRHPSCGADLRAFREDLVYQISSHVPVSKVKVGVSGRERCLLEVVSKFDADFEPELVAEKLVGVWQSKLSYEHEAHRLDVSDCVRLEFVTWERDVFVSGSVLLSPST